MKLCSFFFKSNYRTSSSWLPPWEVRAFLVTFFILPYVEKKPLYCVNKDKRHMLFHLLKFMVAECGCNGAHRALKGDIFVEAYSFPSSLRLFSPWQEGQTTFPSLWGLQRKKRSKMVSRFYFNLKGEGWEEEGARPQVAPSTVTRRGAVGNRCNVVVGHSDMTWHKKALPIHTTYTYTHTHLLYFGRTEHISLLRLSVAHQFFVHYSHVADQRQPLEQWALWCLTVTNPCNSMSYTGGWHP